MLSEEELDNILVRQKDIIRTWLEQIPGSTQSQKLILMHKVRASLSVLKELWVATSYEYKIKELTEVLERVMPKP